MHRQMLQNTHIPSWKVLGRKTKQACSHLPAQTPSFGNISFMFLQQAVPGQPVNSKNEQ